MFKHRPVWDPLLPLQFPHVSLEVLPMQFQCLHFTMLSDSKQMQWSSVILQSKDLPESREEDILNRSEILSPTDSKATFVKVLFHTEELCPGRCNWSKAAPGSLLLLGNTASYIYNFRLWFLHRQITGSQGSVWNQ